MASMLVARHPDGRVILLTTNRDLPPLVRHLDGTWAVDKDMPRDEIDRCVAVTDRAERLSILSSAHVAALRL